MRLGAVCDAKGEHSKLSRLVISVGVRNLSRVWECARSQLWLLRVQEAAEGVGAVRGEGEEGIPLTDWGGRGRGIMRLIRAGLA